MCRLKGENGFTMVETVLSSVIIAIACLGNLVIIQNTYQANITANYQMTATQLANEKIELIIADRSLQPLSYDYVTNVNYPSESIGYGAQPNFFTRTTNVVEVGDDLATAQMNSGLKRVDIDVIWGALPHEHVKVSTVVAKF